MTPASNKEHLPGRLGDDERRPITDYRLDPRLRAHHEKMGTGKKTPPSLASSGMLNGPYQVKIAIVEQMEDLWQSLMAKIQQYDENEFDLTVEQFSVTGVDGNDIPVEIRRPKQQSTTTQLPCICYMHGGGMSMLSMKDAVPYTSSIANQGAIVVSMDFRNAAGALGPHPFPAGLNDCVSVILWVAGHQEQLNYSSLVVAGESGGGNLAIASALKLKKESIIEGVIACCPFLSNAYKDQEYSNFTPPLLSLIENDDYIYRRETFQLISSIYTPLEADATNPLAWPLHASEKDLKGLPPFFISLNELDPLRDEGKAFHHKLIQAGVRSTCYVVCGTQHTDDLMHRHLIPEIHEMTVRNIVSFAKSLVGTPS